MIVKKGDRVALAAFPRGEIVLRWTSFEDFDLVAVYEDSQKGVIYFSSVGSSSKPPYLELKDEIEPTSVEKDNEQRIVVAQMTVKKIWIFAWSFESMLDQTSLDFQANGLHLEVQSADSSWTTQASDLGTGNLCRLGMIHDDGKQIWFENHSDVFDAPVFQEIEELFAFLQ